MAKTKNTAKDYSGMLIPGCMFLGIGVGMLFDQTGAFTIVGLGVGFVLFFIARRK